MTDDFYEDDEGLSDVLGAFAEGESGVTQGPRELDEHAQAIADRAVDELVDAAQTITVYRRIGDDVVEQTWSTTSSTHETTTGDLINA